MYSRFLIFTRGFQAHIRRISASPIVCARKELGGENLEKLLPRIKQESEPCSIKPMVSLKRLFLFSKCIVVDFPDYPPSKEEIANVIRSYVRRNDPHDVDRFVKKVENRFGALLEIINKFSCRESKTRFFANALFFSSSSSINLLPWSSGTNLSLASYKLLMKAFNDAHSPSGVERCLDAIWRKGFRASRGMWNMLVEAYARVGQREQAQYVIERMEREGFTPDDFALCNLIKAHSKANDAEGAVKVREQMNRRGISMTPHAFTSLASVLASHCRKDELLSLVTVSVCFILFCFGCYGVCGSLECRRNAGNGRNGNAAKCQDVFSNCLGLLPGRRREERFGLVPCRAD